MELTMADSETPKLDYSSFVDTSRPFSSVKEAVAVFGERILVGEIYSPKPHFTPTPTRQFTPTPWTFSSPSPINPRRESESEIEIDEQNNGEFFGTLKKIESELEETKMELKMLKERESETEIAVASLNAELHKNMSKLAEAEAKKAAAMARKVSFRDENEENKKKGGIIRMEGSNSSRLAHILSVNENEKGYFGKMNNEKKAKKMKKKPVIPLMGDFFFFRKKGSSNNKSSVDNPLYGVF